MLFCFSNSIAQQFKIIQGIAFTDFNYKTAQGEMAQGLKSGVGQSFQAIFHKQNFLDTNNLKAHQSPLSIYFTQHTKISKLLTLLNLDLGIVFKQMNALGDVQGNVFSYQTNFIGLQSTIGIRIPLPLKCFLNVQGIGSLNRMVHGNQFLINRYIDLIQEPQFSENKFMTGFGVEFEHKFSTRIVGLVSYQQTQTSTPAIAGQSTLNFKPTIFSVGIRFINE